MWHIYLPRLDYLFRKLIAEKRDITIDGTKAFSGDDRFLPGKVALGLGYLLINTQRSDPNFATYLEGYREIADLTVEDANETWGIYYYMSALNKLRKAGLLDETIRPATLQKLREKLDWRPFVKVPEFTLIKLPTNYYGVAFSIARLRMLMGWEDASSSQRLLEQIVNHYQQYWIHTCRRVRWTSNASGSSSGRFLKTHVSRARMSASAAATYMS